MIEIPLPVPAPSTPILTYDPYWLAITRAYSPYFSTSPFPNDIPSFTIMQDKVKRELKWIERHIPQAGKRGVLEVQEFSRVAPAVWEERLDKLTQRKYLYITAVLLF